MKPDRFTFFGVAAVLALSASLSAWTLASEIAPGTEPDRTAQEVVWQKELLPRLTKPTRAGQTATGQAVDQVAAEQLAIVIYREAGGDACCDDCRRRVADVVLNRVADERFPDDIGAVLTQKRQYGTMYWDGVVWPERASAPGEQQAVARAERIAGEVLSGRHSDLYGEGYVFQSEFPDLGLDEGRVSCCGIYFAKG